MICGQNLNMDAVIDKVAKMKSDLLAGMDLDASALKSELASNIDSLVTDLRGLIPEMPEVPSVNLQSELSDLIAMTDTTSPIYLAKLAELKTQFGSALTAAGKDLDSLISSVSTGGLDICGAVPNLELPSGATEAIEKASASLKPQIESKVEELSEITRNKEMFSLKTANESLNTAWTAAVDASSSVFEVAKEASTVMSEEGKEIALAIDTDMLSAFTKPSEPVKTIPAGVHSAFKNMESKFKVTTNTVVGGGFVERKRATYNTSGIAKRPINRTHVEKTNFNKITLKHTPVQLVNRVLVTHKASNGIGNERYEVPPKAAATMAKSMGIDSLAKGVFGMEGLADIYWEMEGDNTILIKNISKIDDITKISVKYVSPSRYDPRYQKQTESETIVAEKTYSNPTADDEGLPTSAGKLTDGGELELTEGDNLSRALL